jgi:hypothetical protein
MFEIYESGLALARIKPAVLPLLDMIRDKAMLEACPLLDRKNLPASPSWFLRLPEVKFSMFNVATQELK